MNEAELVFTEILDCSRVNLYTEGERVLNKDQGALISSVLKARASGAPLAYILGKTEFMGLEFKVNPSVFIPHPDTEVLVETALKAASGMCRQGLPLRVLDIGTGSGCIAVSLARLFPHSISITATDISPAALFVAEENARLNGVQDFIEFTQADLFDTGTEAPADRQFDIIVSNPPYIRSQEIETLEPDSRSQPRLALDAGADGLEFYRRIAGQAGCRLKQAGILAMEIGFDQGKPVEAVFERVSDLKIVEIIKDYGGNDRVVVAEKRPAK